MLVETIKRTEWLKGPIDFAFPPLCLGCGSFDESRVDICKRCLAAINCYTNPIRLNDLQPIPRQTGHQSCGDLSLSLFVYADYASPMKEIIIQFKFHGITSPAGIIANLLCDQFGERVTGLGAEMLVPIPLYPSREYNRGYNQASLFAAELARRLLLPVDEHVLSRVRKRKLQARLDFRQRVLNIKNVFAATDARDRSRLILVDDVVTSGATVCEATRTLTEAGYKVCGVIAMAHGA